MVLFLNRKTGIAWMKRSPLQGTGGFYCRWLFACYLCMYVFIYPWQNHLPTYRLYIRMWEYMQVYTWSCTHQRTKANRGIHAYYTNISSRCIASLHEHPQISTAKGRLGKDADGQWLSECPARPKGWANMGTESVLRRDCGVTHLRMDLDGNNLHSSTAAFQHPASGMAATIQCSHCWIVVTQWVRSRNYRQW